MGEIRRLGEDALLVGVRDSGAARRLIRNVEAEGFIDLAEVVGGLATVLLVFEPDHHGLEAALPKLALLVGEQVLSDPGAPSSDANAPAPLVIPAVFDGPDLAEVADLVGCTPEAVIEAVTAAEFTVAVVGFAPGFAYLAGLPEELAHVPRRARPRPAVAAGSVALANGFAAVYPTASPGGWQLIGRTEMALFTPWAPPFSRLSAGDRVRFSEMSGALAGEAPEDPSRSSPTPWADVHETDAAGRPIFVVEQAGIRTVRQDAGRRGVAALGVPSASPADPYSFRLANELVGNAADADTLEMTASGPTLRCLASTYVAVVGAAPDLRLDGRPVAAGQVLPVSAGQELSVGAIRHGFRSYLGVAGGFVGPEVFGSGASDQLTNLGPGQIQPGDRLWAGAVRPPLGDHLARDVLGTLTVGELIPLRVVPGPHPERFAPDTFASLASARFTVEPESNRVGLRLRRDPTTPALGLAPGPARRTGFPGHGDGRRAGSARRGAGDSPDRPCHPGWVPGSGRCGGSRSRAVGPVCARRACSPCAH